MGRRRAPQLVLGDAAERWTINGWFHAGDLGRPPVPVVTPSTRNLLARRIVPTVTSGFALRPTPDAVDRLLQARWQLDAHEITDEATDEHHDIGGARGHLPIGALADDLLTRLQPVHEEWAGCPLTGSAAYGRSLAGTRA